MTLLPGGWLELGVGPWFVMRDLSMQALYRGRQRDVHA
jgi:hypothetical protein